jgi:arylsulfatase A-like enzyme/Flp pilus assembly protein TadD
MRRSIAVAMLIAIGVAACGRKPENAGQPAKPNILLVTIDTFRADRLGAGVAPALDRLAASAVQFTSARAAVPLTLPSHATILTGLLPPEHGVRENGIDTLSDAHQTTARLLKAAGYQTAAFVGAFVLDRQFGLAQGFDTYDDQIPRDPNATERLEAERPAAAVVDRALAWLERVAPGTSAPGTKAPSTSAPSTVAPSTLAPFFVWIHLYDPHAPYNPPREFIRATSDEPRATSTEPRAPSNEQRYEGEIRYADAQIARVFEWLNTHALRDRTLVVVAGDHGEGLGEHGERTHGMLLYDATLRVPLIVSAPGAAAARRDEPVSLADIAPTIVRAAGVAVPAAMKGRDLLGGMGRMAVNGGMGDLYSETEYPRVAGWSPLQALTDGRWMAIKGGGATAVYDLQSDPREERDAAPAQPSIAAAMAARIDVIRQRGSSSSGRTISSDAAERLRALGYVASSSSPASGDGGPHPASKIAAWNEFEDALAALNARHAEAAVAVLTKLAAANPDAAVFQTTYARALLESGQKARALDVYRQAAKRWPTDPLLLHDLAVAARDAAGRTEGAAARVLLDEAVRADQAALVVAPRSAMAHNGLGLLAIDRGRPQDAVKEFEQATTIDPNNAVYWANLGNARRATQETAGAEQAYRRAVEVDARTPDALNGLGVLLVETTRPAEAVPLFEHALAAAPDFLEARLNLGIALQQSGQNARAADVYRQVLAAPASYKRERDAAAHLLAALGSAR